MIEQQFHRLHSEQVDKMRVNQCFSVFGADDVHPDRIYRGPYFVTQPQDIRFQISIDAPACTQDCPSVTFECDAKGYPQPTYQWYEGLGAEVREIERN